MDGLVEAIVCEMGCLAAIALVGCAGWVIAIVFFVLWLVK